MLSVVLCCPAIHHPDLLLCLWSSRVAIIDWMKNNNKRSLWRSKCVWHQKKSWYVAVNTVPRNIYPQSDFLCFLKQIFMRDISLLCSVQDFSSTLTRLPASTAETYSHSMMLPPLCFMLGMDGQRALLLFLQILCLEFRQKKVQSWFQPTREDVSQLSFHKITL